jgi:hypothetical protein
MENLKARAPSAQEAGRRRQRRRQGMSWRRRRSRCKKISKEEGKKGSMGSAPEDYNNLLTVRRQCLINPFPTRIQGTMLQFM